MVWKRTRGPSSKTSDCPQEEEITVPEIVDESQIAPPLQSYRDPPAVHSNEGCTLVSSSNDLVPVTTERPETATLPVDEIVTDTSPSPPRRYPCVCRPPE